MNAPDTDFEASRNFKKPRVGTHVHVPLRALTAQPYAVAPWPVSATDSGGNLIREQRPLVSDLLSWSSCIAAGARTLENLRENHALTTITKLPATTWQAEVGNVVENDPVIEQVALANPKRVCGRCVLSRQLLISGRLVWTH